MYDFLRIPPADYRASCFKRVEEIRHSTNSDFISSARIHLDNKLPVNNVDIINMLAEAKHRSISDFGFKRHYLYCGKSGRHRNQWNLVDEGLKSQHNAFKRCSESKNVSFKTEIKSQIPQRIQGKSKNPDQKPDAKSKADQSVPNTHESNCILKEWLTSKEKKQLDIKEQKIIRQLQRDNELIRILQETNLGKNLSNTTIQTKSTHSKHYPRPSKQRSTRTAFDSGRPHYKSSYKSIIDRRSATSDDRVTNTSNRSSTVYPMHAIKHYYCRDK